jgi:antitoxin (DNA-binding transcriptional repressor) of toxin-antitoxin stability system
LFATIHHTPISADQIYLISSPAMVRMTATEVSRRFSSVINRVDSGEEIEIVRNGKAVAELRRPSQPTGISGAALRELLDGLPPLDAELAREVERERERLGAEPGAWPES